MAEEEKPGPGIITPAEPDPEPKPCAPSKGQAAIEMAATLFSSDNLVILCLTGLVAYALYQFGSTKPDIAEKIITNVASGMIGYLGNEVKKKVTSGGG